MTLRWDEAPPLDNRAPWLAGSNTAAHKLSSSGEHESSEAPAENFHQENASREKRSLFRLSPFKLYTPSGFLVSVETAFYFMSFAAMCESEILKFSSCAHTFWLLPRNPRVSFMEEK